MQFDFKKLAPLERYKLLLATVLPRPIAWITTGVGRMEGGWYTTTRERFEMPAIARRTG